MRTIHRAAIAGLAAATIAGAVFADSNHSDGPEGTQPVQGIAHLDHVFLIMMENHAYAQVIGNPNMPFFNQLAKSANLATNYYAVGHPSLTNYLEIVGGSNFGIRNDNSPVWHVPSCAPGYVYLEGDPTGICPLANTGVGCCNTRDRHHERESGIFRRGCGRHSGIRRRARHRQDHCRSARSARNELESL